MELQKICTDDIGILTAFAESRIGGRPENQDSYGWKETSLGYLVTVCDGMGGGPGGKTASTIAVSEIITGISEANKDEEIPNIIIKAIRRANMAIIEAGNETPALKGMGSTATVLLISENSAFVAHVGDSRVYQIRSGKKIFRTFDHSMVFEMVQQGVITEEQARLSAQSNIITRALGIKPDVEVSIKEVSFEAGDRFVLCSDGIHGSMPEEEFIKMLSKILIRLFSFPLLLWYNNFKDGDFDMKPRVNLVIPNNMLFRKKVGIYCRVSTKSDAQLHSISEQIAGLTATVAANSEWELVNVYIDIKCANAPLIPC